LWPERARSRIRPLAIPDLSDLWHGLLGPLVRAADGRWDLGVVRTPAVLAAALVAAIAVAGWRAQAWRTWVLVAACVAVILLVTVPATAAPGGPARRLGAVVPHERLTYQIVCEKR